MSTDIGYVGLALSGILVGIAVVISLVRSLGLERSILWAALRALVQLLAVGVALGLVVDDGDPLVFSWIWIVVMVLFASWTVGRRVPTIKGAQFLAAAGFSAALLVTLGVLFGFGVFELRGRSLVPLAGMIVGNSLSATVLVARRVTAEATEHRDLIEGRLSLGLSADESFAPHLRSALKDALTPQIETTKAVGIVFLPGAMVGLILAGVEPTDAVRVQAAVMYLILGSVATTSTVMGIGLSRRLFSKDHRLLPKDPT